MAVSAIDTHEKDRGGYVELEPPPENGVFEIGLVMAGAISAGAYTAGVVDFLIEALDSWEAAKREQTAKSSDPLTWGIPGHRARIRVVSGASAGSMTGAIAALALKYDFPHVRNGIGTQDNPLYKAWVKDIDISKLLQTRDLKETTAPVVSVLDSTALPEILSDALDFRGTSQVSRPYVAPAVRYIFTEGNLRGIPYFMELPGNLNAGLAMISHSDYQGFCVNYNGAPGLPRRVDDVLTLFPNSSQDPNWRALGTASLASGAFPFGLAPQVIERKGTDFQYRFVLVPGIEDKPAEVVQLTPRWRDPTPPSPFRSTVVDGGTMNNDPLDLARIELAGLAGRNPRNGNLANRATVLIDPFPDLAGTIDDPNRGQHREVMAVATALMSAWKDQARFDPIDLALAADESVYSRFMIAPGRGTSKESNGFALACGALGGFSGFLCEPYRHHDYLLGRRNCQQFLRRHFLLPAGNNPVFSSINPALKQEGSPWVVSMDGERFLPIIPLVGDVTKEEVLPPWPTKAFDPQTLRPLETSRLDAVLDHLLRNSIHLNWFFRWVAKLGLIKVRNVAVDKTVEIVTQGLQQRALI
jgi:predicted acylesterase/phospholipase RssA